MSIKRRPFDISEHLDSPEAVIEYLDQVLADNDTDELIRAIGHVARARGMTQVARDAGLGRESLYKALTPGANPRADTIFKVIRALGIRLHAA